MRLINTAGLALIKTDEGLELTAYQDQRGIWTIGYGHTPAWKGETIALAQADHLLAQDCGWAAVAVDAVTHDVPTSDNQFSAMASLCFNIGAAAFRSSSIVRLHRLKQYAGAADAFLLWNKLHIDGKLVASPGLTRRRQEERALYLKP